MKTIYFIITILFPLMTFSQVKKIPAKDSVAFNRTAILNPHFNFIVVGKIDGYTPDDSNGYITFRTYTINGHLRDTIIPIEKNGKFTFNGFQPFEGDIAFFYKNSRDIILYAKPYEKIELEINEKKWAGLADKYKAIKIKGVSAATSLNLIHFSEVLSSYQYVQSLPVDSIKYPDSSLAKIFQRRLVEEEILLGSFIQNNNVRDTLFEQWYRDQLMINSSIEINYSLFGGRINDQVEYDQFVKFTNSTAILKAQSFNVSSFYSFLAHFTRGVQIISAVNPKYKDSVSNVLFNTINMLGKFSQGLVLDLAYSNLYNQRLPAASVISLDSLITNEYVKSELYRRAGITKNFESYNILTSIRKIKGGVPVAQKLKKILDSNPGAVLFLNFWATYCAPCMEEMKLFETFHKEYSGKKIRVIFLGQNTNKNTVDSVSKKFKLKGDFINLNANETSIYNIAFNFNALPAHFLMNSDGILFQKLPTINVGGKLNPELIKYLNDILEQETVL